MAASKVLCTAGKALGGIFLSLSGSWLLLVCLGGLLSLGMLSVFYLSVLVSLGCIGVCLLVAGVCVLSHVMSTGSKKEKHPWFEDNSVRPAFEETVLPSAHSKKIRAYHAPLHQSRSENNRQLE